MQCDGFRIEEKRKKSKRMSSLGRNQTNKKSTALADNPPQHTVPIRDYNQFPLNLRDFRKIPLT